MIYVKLFWDFFRVSCFTFGGAYAAIPLIRDMVLSNGWMGDDKLVYMIAVSESTPGPIMVNLATYIGQDQAGFWGSLIATVGVVLPAYLIIVLIVTAMRALMKNRYAQAVLRGLKPCVIGMVSAMGVYLVISNVLGTLSAPAPDVRALLITAVLAAALVILPKITGKKVSPIMLICISAVLGVMVYSF